jgi:hypothetical protein
LPLELDIQDDAGPNLAAFVADRALIQVRTAEDGSQPHLARYWVHTINAPFIDVELPLPLSRFREPPTIFLGDHALRQWKKLDASEKILRIQLHPEQAKLPASLEIAYTIPADTLERVGFWSTTLQAPVFKSDVLITQMRWQLTTPSPMIAVSLDHNVRTEMQWTFQGWLFTPESTGVDGESWLSGKDQDASANPATFGFAHVSLQPEAVYHFSRPWWLLGCSGVFLVLTLGAYFSPLPRWCFWFLLAALCAGMLFFAVAYPGAWHAVAFGMQPGVVLFLAFVGVHWTLQERYRRQLIFLPSFARAKAGSTITRTRAKRTRESSTVDAPPGASAAPSTSSETPAAS